MRDRVDVVIFICVIVVAFYCGFLVAEHQAMKDCPSREVYISATPAGSLFTIEGDPVKGYKCSWYLAPDDEKNTRVIK